MPTSQPGVKLFRVRLDSVDSHVQGYLAIPDRRGKLPALIIYQWAGVYPLDPAWAGYPEWDSTDPQVMRTALYFDTVNFTPRITAPTLIAMGFIDTTAPPVGIWTELDEIPAPKEAVPMVESEHNNFTPQKQDAWLKRSEEVLATPRARRRVPAQRGAHEGTSGAMNRRAVRPDAESSPARAMGGCGGPAAGWLVRIARGQYLGALVRTLGGARRILPARRRASSEASMIKTARPSA